MEFPYCQTFLCFQWNFSLSCTIKSEEADHLWGDLCKMYYKYECITELETISCKFSNVILCTLYSVHISRIKSERDEFWIFYSNRVSETRIRRFNLIHTLKADVNHRFISYFFFWTCCLFNYFIYLFVCLFIFCSAYIIRTVFRSTNFILNK